MLSLHIQTNSLLSLSEFDLGTSLVTLCTPVCVWLYWHPVGHCGNESVLPLWWCYCVWCQICDLGIYQWLCFLFVLHIKCGTSCIPSNILNYFSGKCPWLLYCRICCFKFLILPDWDIFLQYLQVLDLLQPLLEMVLHWAIFVLTIISLRAGGFL